jgi:hypothetical protein
VKSTLNGHLFEAIEERRKLLWDPRAILQRAFQDAFQNWKKHWKLYIGSAGEFFGGDKFY